jgi:hypothetical protein
LDALFPRPPLPGFIAVTIEELSVIDGGDLSNQQ